MNRSISLLVGLLLLVMLPACQIAEDLGLPEGFPGGWFGQPQIPAASSTPPAADTATAPPPDPQAVTPSPGAPPVPALTLWVPPEFDPNAGTHAGDLLGQRIQAFSEEYDVEVFVRVKAASGPGGLLESLNAASAAAPLALPSVVALPRADVEFAALKGLVFPLDGVSSLIDQPDWYDYARSLALVQGATYALPFAGDALVVAYRPAQVIGPPVDLDSVYRLGQPLAFPAGDPQALFVLSLYRSLGGQVEDAQGRPTLQPEVLSQVLQVLADGEQRAIFPYWLTQYETNGQVWQAYRDGRVNVLATWVSNYLSSLPPDTYASPMPAIGGTSLTIATGWGWAVADPLPERRKMSIRLAEFLSDGQFLAGWTESAGYLPTRPSSLAGWTNQSLKTLLSPVAVSAQGRPSVDQLSSIGPVLKDAAVKVLKRESDPAQAAKSAAEKLTIPEMR